MSIKAYKVESDDEEGKNWHTIGYATGLEDDIKKHFDDSKVYKLRLAPIEIVDLSNKSDRYNHNSNNTTKKKGRYQVFYKRDLDFEKSESYGQKMLFDLTQKFSNKDKAYEFAYGHISTVMIEKMSYENIQSSEDSEYIVAARFVGKYNHHDYGGDRDPLTNYDILRCKKNELEDIIESFAKEGAKEIITGVEVKLF